MGLGPPIDTSRRRPFQFCTMVFLLGLVQSVPCVVTGTASALTPTAHTDREVVAVLEYYLDADCVALPKNKEDQKKPFGALAKLLSYKNNPALEARLMEILRIGLYPDDIAPIRASFKKEWEHRQAIIGRALRTREFRPDSAIKEGAYVDLKVKELIWMYQQKAAVALVVLDTENAKTELLRALQLNPKLLQIVTATLARFGGSLVLPG